ncbi:hypothetical protein P1X14_05810 [Sphingomonas sp. AOB5]|uniref:DUF4139 domain-containing protein n=1 Tax=Sphingomonas sp. AOB5 TaxID=3034017 RepID=UPI0023F84D57|nr:hypothetical protein [Sphingomonas sp. AOB5]MDF7774750.1 hypothetical protein [Sphingomonas sp. AOB5]
MRPIRALIALIATLLASAPAFAQTVSSPGPESVAVTIYRAPGYDPADDQQFETQWLEGYALVTEQRTITIPAGRGTIRFEGVAGGILPESAIVTGLPDGVREKNLDADLLSPRSLYDRSLGRPVTIRRTVNGKSVEEPAIIRSGPNGAAIVQTRTGFIALNCGNEDEAIVYNEVPPGLTAKPTLSIETDSPVERKVTVTLSYLAWGFEWKASYVATMRPDGKTADLFAWVTLANGDVTSFENAETMVVAGEVNREDEDSGEPLSGGSPLEMRCFALPELRGGVTDSLPMAAPPMEMADVGDSEIIVTAQRMSSPVQVQQEELGDLKLYRVPHRTTVASMGIKQVALMDRESVPVDVVYKASIRNGSEYGVYLYLRAQNRKDKGLGLALPAGQVAVFEPLGDSRALIGEGSITDKAVGEEVEIQIAESYQVNAMVDETGTNDDGSWTDQLLTVTNANPFPVRFEAELTADDGWTRARTSARLKRKNGRDVWAVEIPANGKVELRYRLVEQRRND